MVVDDNWMMGKWDDGIMSIVESQMDSPIEDVIPRG